MASLEPASETVDSADSSTMLNHTAASDVGPVQAPREKRQRTDEQDGQHSQPTANSGGDAGAKVQHRAGTAVQEHDVAASGQPPAADTTLAAVATAAEATATAAVEAAAGAAEGAAPRRKKRFSTFEESAEGWSKPLKWLTQCDPVKLHHYTLQWIELVRRCGHAQKRSGHNLNAYAGSKPVSLQLTVLDLQLPPPPPRSSPQKSTSITDTSGATDAEVEDTTANSTMTTATDDPAINENMARDTTITTTSTADNSVLPAVEGPTSPKDDDNEEDNVARILRLATKPAGLDAEEAVWLATTIDQALALLDHAGARAALSAIRSTLIAGQERHVRLVSKPTAAGANGTGANGSIDAVAAVAAAAAEQLGGAASSRRTSGQTRGKGRGKGREYPVDCVVDGDTGAILSA